MTSPRSMLAGGVMIVAGIVFIGASNTGGRSSTLGLVVGIGIVLLGVLRIFRGNREAPPVG